MALDYRKIQRALENNCSLVLFLDYDGTLADFTKRPDIVEPNPEVVKLVNALIGCKNITPAIISGRRLSHIQKLLPFRNIFLSGTYGLEIQIPGKEIHYPLNFKAIRSALEKLKPDWQRLIRGKDSFFLEDKGWTLAIHARYAEDQKADGILSAADKVAREKLDLSIFQVNLGNKFLEASPIQADKGVCVKHLMKIMPTKNAAMIYLGDDDKDEQAFKVVQSHGGFAIRVCSNVINNPIEDWRLENPKAARDWLWTLISQFC